MFFYKYMIFTRILFSRSFMTSFYFSNPPSSQKPCKNLCLGSLPSKNPFLSLDVIQIHLNLQSLLGSKFSGSWKDLLLNKLGLACYEVCMLS